MLSRAVLIKALKWKFVQLVRPGKTFLVSSNFNRQWWKLELIIE